jgi:hypothetical protein
MQARKWVAQRAAGLQELTLRPRHAPSAGAIAPLWPRLAGSLRTLDLSLERELPDCKPQVGAPTASVRPLQQHLSRVSSVSSVGSNTVSRHSHHRTGQQSNPAVTGPAANPVLDRLVSSQPQPACTLLATA